MTKIDNLVNKNKGKIALISLLSGLLTITSVYFAYSRVAFAEVVTSTTSSPKTALEAKSDQICPTGGDIKVQVWCLLDKYGLTLEEKIKAVSVIDCESKWNFNAFNSKTDDFGLWQISYPHQIKTGKTTIACSMDIICSTDFAMKLFLENGRSFKLWSCN